MRYQLALIILCGLLMTESLLADTNNAQAKSFVDTKGIEINPACLQPWVPNMESGDIAVPAIDITQCQTQYKKTPYQHTVKNFLIYPLQYGFIGYKYIGQLANGAQVLDFIQNGGGTGEFESLFIVKQQQLQIINQSFSDKVQKQTFDYLFLQRIITAGDRCMGGIANVTLQGNTLTITQYNGDNAVDCAPQKELKHQVQVSE